MGTIFDAPSISGYNSNPPPDDGTASAANTIEWDKHKTKLGDPVKTLAESTVTNVTAAVAKLVGGAGISAQTDNYTVLEGDQGKLVDMSVADKTLTTPDATVVGAPFVFAFLNSSSGNMTLDPSGSQTLNGSAASVTVPSGKGGWLFTDGTNWFAPGLNFADLPRGHIAGLQMSNGTDSDHDIDISAGECRDTANTANLSLSAVMTKQIDASWAAGTAAGGMASGVSLDVDTWYHVFLVDDGAGGTDAGFDTSVTATNLLATSGVGTQYRRLGSVLTDGSSNIIAFTQFGDNFVWASPVLDVNTDTLTATLQTLSVPVDVKVLAKMNVMLEESTLDFHMYISSPDATDLAASKTAAPLATAGATVASAAGSDYVASSPAPILTNTSSQVRTRGDGGTGNIKIATLGWDDDRGRNS